jgi:hypothetical protein
MKVGLFETDWSPSPSPASGIAMTFGLFETD